MLINKPKERIDRNSHMKNLRIDMSVIAPYSIAMSEMVPSATDAPARIENFHPSSASTRKETAVTVEIPMASRKAPKMTQKTVCILFEFLFLDRKKSIGIKATKRMNVTQPSHDKIVDCHEIREIFSIERSISSGYQNKGFRCYCKKRASLARVKGSWSFSL